MKDYESLVQGISRFLEVKGNLSQEYYLQPVGRHFSNDRELIFKLVQWRNQFSKSYPTRFIATFESTKNWLDQQVVNNDYRLMFLVVDSRLKVHGHLGLLYLNSENVLEIDNVVKDDLSEKGLMYSSMLSMEKWVHEQLAFTNVQLRVLGSNKHAQRFYDRLGYATNKSENLISVIAESSSKLVPGIGQITDQMIYMQKDLLYENAIPKNILTAGPIIGARELSYTHDAIAHGWNSNHSTYIKKFENDFANYIGVNYAISTSSCTGALHLALLSLGITEGDEVIVPDITWVATASAIAYVGATPVFCDVNLNDWTLDLTKLEDCITSRTKAIMVVHLYGYVANMQSINELAKKYGLFVVEDAAAAAGGLWQGSPAGSLSDVACFSFQGAKMTVTGEGGMLVTSSPEIYSRAWKFQDHGRVPGTFQIDTLGYKYKMSNVCAALGLAQLNNIETFIDLKTNINIKYQSSLNDLVQGGIITFQKAIEGARSVHWMTSILLMRTETNRAASDLRKYLAAKNIDTRPVFPSISQYPIWNQETPHPINSTVIAGNGINLPSGAALKHSSIEYVCSQIHEFFNTN